MTNNQVPKLYEAAQAISNGIENISVEELEGTYQAIHGHMKIAYKLEADIFNEMNNDSSKICTKFVSLEESLLKKKQDFLHEFIKFGDTNSLNKKFIKSSYEDLKQKLLTLIEATKHEQILHEFSRDFKNRIASLENILSEEVEEQKYNALVLKGGGIKGIAYVGALEVLEKYYSFNWFAGTSAGAITATLLAAGFTNDDLKKELLSKDFSDFKDAGLFGKWLNLFTKFGFYEAFTFEKWIDKLLTNKFDSHKRVTLQDISVKTGNRISIFACRKDKNVLIFDSEKPESKYASFAARCSMSIPFLFTPRKSEGLNVFDGGLKNNYPVDIVLESEENVNFIGLYLGNELYESPNRNGLFSVVNDVFSIWQENNDVENLSRFSEQTIIIDPRPVKTTDFRLTNEEKEFLLECGRLSAAKYLKKQGFELDQTDYNERKIALETLRTNIRKVRQKRILKKKVIMWLVILFCCLYFIFKVVW